VKPRSQGDGVRQVRVTVGPRNSALDSKASPAPNHAKSSSPVVVAPQKPCRSPRSWLIALVGIDGRRVKGHHLGHVGDPSTQKPTENIRALDGTKPAVAGKGVLTIAPKAQVNVAA